MVTRFFADFSEDTDCWIVEDAETGAVVYSCGSQIKALQKMRELNTAAASEEALNGDPFYGHT